MKSTRSIGKRLEPSVVSSWGLDLSRSWLAFTQNGKRTPAIDSDSSLLYCVGIVGSTTARDSYSSRRCSDVKEMLVSERREPAAHPERPARVIFDLLNLIRLHLDTRTKPDCCHTSLFGAAKTLLYGGNFNGLRRLDLMSEHNAVRKLLKRFAIAGYLSAKSLFFRERRCTYHCS
jgi:hypothetical protein